MYFLSYFFFIAIVLLVFFVLRRRNSSKLRQNPMIILGSGGHTTEILDLLEKIQIQQIKQIVFITAQTDHTSTPRAIIHLQKNKIQTPIKWQTIPRSRQVKQSYITSIHTTIKSIIFSFVMILRSYRHIDILITNGPGTCVPIVYIYAMLNYLCITNCKLVFVQSWCRVTSLSLTGKLLKPIVHNFFVQWKGLKQRYPQTILINRD